MALVQPVPPPTHGTARPAAAPRALSQRGPRQHTQQCPRLHASQIPTTRRQRTRQRRAASPTACLSPAQETRNRNRIELPGISIGLALIATMRPQPSQTTPRTARRSIRLGLLQQHLQMVFKAGDCSHNVWHRRVFLLSRTSSDNAHDTREARLASSPHRHLTPCGSFEHRLLPLRGRPRGGYAAAQKPFQHRLRHRNEERSSRAAEGRRTLATLIASRGTPESVFSNILGVRGKMHPLMPQIKADVTADYGVSG